MYSKNHWESIDLSHPNFNAWLDLLRLLLQLLLFRPAIQYKFFDNSLQKAKVFELKEGIRKQEFKQIFHSTFGGFWHKITIAIFHTDFLEFLFFATSGFLC